jgi:ABC-type polysaccharide/polyol phosphate export permease
VIADFAALLRHRQLVQDFAWRDLRARYKGSVLGFAWNFLNPLLQLAVYYLLFGVLLPVPRLTAGGEAPAYGYAVFLFTGLLPWTYFASSLQAGASAVLANAGLVKKVRLPLPVLPAAAVLSSLANFALGLVVLAAVLVVAGVPPHLTLVYVPLIVAVQTILNLGFAYALSALAVFFRDVLHILGILLTLWYFLTPVIFPLASVAQNHPTEAALLRLNPMTPIVVSYQRVVLDGLAPEWAWLAYSAAFALVVFFGGFAFYRRASASFEEEL